MEPIIEAAPKLQEFLSPQSVSHFDALRSMLDAQDIIYHINPHLVRGLDYYSNTVFEWVSNELGAQGTVCAGGRYDGLVALMGGRPTPAIGFALGLERLVEMVLCQLRGRRTPKPTSISSPRRRNTPGRR